MENTSSTAELHPETLLERYTKARQHLSQCQVDLTESQHFLTLMKATVEQQIIEDAGSVKNLGPNETEQKRVLAYKTYEHPSYAGASRDMRDRSADLAAAEAELDCIKFEMRLYEASLKEREITNGIV